MRPLLVLAEVGEPRPLSAQSTAAPAAARDAVFARLAYRVAAAGQDLDAVCAVVARTAGETFAGPAALMLAGAGEMPVIRGIYHPTPGAADELSAIASGAGWAGYADVARLVLATGHPIVLSAARLAGLREVAPAPLADWMRRHRLSGLAMFPLQGHNGLLGVLAVACVRPGGQGLLPDETAFLDDLADRVSLHVDNACLLATATGELRQRAAAEELAELRASRQAAVADLGTLALSGASVSDLMEQAVDEVALHLDVPVVFVLESVPDEGLRLRTGRGLPTEAFGRVESPGVPGHLAATVLAGPEPVRVEDAANSDDRIGPWLDGAGVVSGLAVRVQCGRTPLGVIGAFSRQPRGFTEDDVVFLRSVANVLAAVLEQRRSEEGLRRQALRDPLTGLPSRAFLTSEIELALARCAASGRVLHLFLLDLDRFKLLNVSHGHLAGDDVLRAVANRLTIGVPAGHTVARLGGDEFVVLAEVPAGSGPLTAVRTARGLQELLRAPFPLQQGEVFVSASVGIAMSGGGTRTDAASLLRDADTAMYRAKERRGVEMFHDRMRAATLNRLSIDTGLRRALERDELRLVFQPMVRAADEQLVAVEALLRWARPGHGIVSPSVFIPVAEETGLIKDLGKWVMLEACRYAAWWNADRARPPLEVSVNVSPRQFRDAELLRCVRQATSEAGVQPGWLCVEITESSLEDASTARGVLHGLKDAGLSLSIDDFGTGYSSLAQLRHFPLDNIKVDRAFVTDSDRGPGPRALVAAVLGVGRALGLRVVAEGVETAGQARVLRDLGCDLLQGFRYGRPDSADAITHRWSGGC